ncbi:hypothetical protein BH23BAC4_BH23BAC4_12960 [soil metagenome]
MEPGWFRVMESARKTGAIRAAVCYAIGCLLLWPWPLFGILHAESSAVIAGLSFFAAGLTSVRALGAGQPVLRVLLYQMAALAVPFVLLTMSLIWRPNCAYLTGAGLFVVLAGPSVVLAVGVAYFTTAVSARARLWLSVVGLVLLVGGVVFDLAFHPQFYSYNHVFGGVLGPIYDDELSIRLGLFAFRSLTLLWAALAVSAGAALSNPKGSASRLRLTRTSVALALAIGTCYLFREPLGINTTEAGLIRDLGAIHQAGAFEIVYDSSVTSDGEVAAIANELRYRQGRYEARLGMPLQEPVLVFLYPDPDTKGRLTGSRYTGVAPVWLRRAQVHLLASRAEILPHELVHVMARQYGGLFGASSSIAIVEGLAVALEPPQGFPSPVQLLAATAALGDSLGGVPNEPGATVRQAFAPFLFWTMRGPVAYSAAGSFMRFVLDTHGPEAVARVYRYGSVERGTGASLDQLVTQWEEHIAGVEVTPEVRTATLALLSRPSLFERRCPHYVPSHIRETRRGIAAVAAGDVPRAEQAFERALAARPGYGPALDGWARIRLAAGDPEAVLNVIADSLAEGSASASVRRGDAFLLLGNADRAADAYKTAAHLLSPFDRDSRLAIAMRAQLTAEILHVLVQIRPAEERATSLAAFGDLAATFFAGASYWEAGAFGAAADHLSASLPLASGTINEGALHHLVARSQERAGRIRDAEQSASSAEVAFLREGDRLAGAQMFDLRTRLAWLLPPAQ